MSVSVATLLVTTGISLVFPAAIGHILDASLHQTFQTRESEFDIESVSSPAVVGREKPLYLTAFVEGQERVSTVVGSI